MKPTQRSPVRSSSVRSIGYRAKTATLEIEFHGGAVYRYLAVPAAVHARLMSAPSIGAFVNREIKPRYRYLHVLARSAVRG
jgi:hypothetical protein